MNAQRLGGLSGLLRERRSALDLLPVVAGFDGFIDEMISLVAERRGLDQWSAVNDMTAFAELIRSAAGRSSLREIVVHRMDPGGCTVNLGDGLATLGVPLHAFATLGQPRQPAFNEFAAKCRTCHSWGRSYGRTLAFEFADGKFMFSAVSQLAEFNPQLLEQTLSDGQYAAACLQARAIALTNWSLYPHMTDCWLKLQSEVYSKLSHRPLFFLDLVDPGGRSDADIGAMLRALPGFEQSGPTVLGLNGNEANILCRVLDLPIAEEESGAVQRQAAALRHAIGISQVVIHCVKLAAAADQDGVTAVKGPYCPQPRKSTGAGDRFNAGYVLARILGLDTEQSLLLGSAASGFFVRQARSATAEELAGFLLAWAEGNC